MPIQRYSVTASPIETLVISAKSGGVDMSPLVHEIARIEVMANTVETITERPQEYHTALITAAVTSRIDARGAAA